jgi:hypothetical protein
MNKQKQDELILILENILKDDKNRSALVRNFQNEIWLNEEQELGEDNPDFLILSELAYDLDYYEPNSKLRQEDSSFFDDEVLFREIKSALNTIKQKK